LIEKYNFASSDYTTTYQLTDQIKTKYSIKDETKLIQALSNLLASIENSTDKFYHNLPSFVCQTASLAGKPIVQVKT
jgi:hypothetical protein